MGIIVPEYILEDIVELMPTITYPDSVERNIKFGYGDKKELNRYLALKQDASYPLIWLLMPERETLTYQFSKDERDCRFIIATLEDRADLFNSQRYRGAFDQFLIPVANLLIEGIQSASTTRFANTDELGMVKHPNYSEESDSNESGSIELWDALRLDCRIEFNNSCLRQIKWITNTT